MIVNPGTRLFTLAAGAAAIVTYADFPNAATTVSSLNNDPAAVLS